MDAGLGRDLSNTAQVLLGDELPLMLLVAGTPDLPKRLSRMSASFWSRCHRLRIGRLRPAASADAIRIPFEERDQCIEDRALARVVSESQCYPYFLQFWGRLLWKLCPDPNVPVSCAEVDRAKPLFVSARSLYYEDRFEELNRARLVEAACGVAALFASSERRRSDEVEAVVRACRKGSGGAVRGMSAEEACDRLRNLGYVRTVIDEDIQCYEPGIPSLMTFVSRNSVPNAKC